MSKEDILIKAIIKIIKELKIIKDKLDTTADAVDLLVQIERSRQGDK